MKISMPTRSLILQKLRSLKQKSSSVDNTSRTPQVNDDEMTRELNQKLTNAFNISGSEDELIENVQIHLMSFGDYYRESGRNHGRIGARDFQIHKTAHAHASLITERVISGLRGHIAALNFVIDKQKGEFEELKIREKQCGYNLQELETLAHNDPKRYNAVNCVIYFLAGIAMIAADVAVSINLVSFFGVGAVQQDDTFWTKSADPELLLFSLGIALCTIFVKIIYDEYISGKLGQIQLQIRDLQKNGANRALLLAEIGIKFLIKLLILIALGYLLYYLAVYRTYFTLYGELREQLVAMQSDPVTSNVGDVLLKSFIGITVIIPIISGIALSSSLTIFSNKRALIGATENLKTAGQKTMAVSSLLQTKTYNLKKLEQYENEWQHKQEKIKLETAYFVQVYEQGFRVSYRIHHGHDLYRLIEEYRNEVINQAFSARLNPQ